MPPASSAETKVCPLGVSTGAPAPYFGHSFAADVKLAGRPGSLIAPPTRGAQAGLPTTLLE